MKKVVAFAGLLMFFLVCCEQEDFSRVSPEDLLLQAENETIAEAVLQNTEDQIDKEIGRLENVNFNPLLLKSAEVGACDPVVTVKKPENSDFPKTITLDWGSGCTDTEGNFRAGKVVVHITGPYWEKNTVRTAKLENYRFNDLKVKGERKEMNKGANAKGYILFDVNLSLTFTDADKGSLICDRDWSRSRVYDRGTDLKSNSDDQVWVTGTGKVGKNNEYVVKEIMVPLYRKISCPHFMSGVITTYRNKEKESSLDYGKAGDCDNKAVWTNFKTGKSKEITLKHGVKWFSVKK